MTKKRYEAYLTDRVTVLATSSTHLSTPETLGFSTLPHTARRWSDECGRMKVVSLDEGQREEDLMGGDMREFDDQELLQAREAVGRKRDYFL